MKEWLDRMLDHMEWADAAVIESLRRQGGSPKAIGIMAHIVAATHLWLSRARGENPTVAVWPRVSLDECLRISKENVKGFKALAEQAARVPPPSHAYANSKGEKYQSPLDDILLHVLNHAAYHRGQVALLQRADGQEPAYTDYIQYVRAVRGRK
jgi:uncharacterized damage-inducible protein DinB